MEMKDWFKRAAILVALTAGLLITFMMRTTELSASRVHGQTQVPASQVISTQPALSAVTQATSAAYRDGFYVGKIAGKRGDQPHVSVGRWSSEEDQTAYAAGYLEGYDAIAGQAATSQTGETTDSY